MIIFGNTCCQHLSCAIPNSLQTKDVIISYYSEMQWSLQYVTKRRIRVTIRSSLQNIFNGWPSDCSLHKLWRILWLFVYRDISFTFSVFNDNNNSFDETYLFSSFNLYFQISNFKFLVLLINMRTISFVFTALDLYHYGSHLTIRPTEADWLQVVVQLLRQNTESTQ